MAFDPAMPNGSLLDAMISSASSFNNWTFPTKEELKKEYDVEYQYHILWEYGPIWSSFDDFVNAAGRGVNYQLSHRDDLQIDNRSHCNTMTELVSLVSTYRSWPKFRNMNTLMDMINRFRNNEPMKMPIILDHHGNKRIMSGNTKLDIAFMMNVVPQVLVISLDV